MRESHEAFRKHGITVLAVSQDDATDVTDYWENNAIPFIGIPDPDGVLKERYNQESRMGPLPAVFVIDGKGIVRLAHYGDGMKDIPPAAEILRVATVQK